MIKKHRNKEHLNSLILGAIENDRIDELKFYTKLLDDNKNSEFLKSALIKCKLESSKFLSEMGFTISSPLFVLLNSPIENMYDDVLASKLIDKILDNTKEDVIIVYTMPDDLTYENEKINKIFISSEDIMVIIKK